MGPGVDLASAGEEGSAIFWLGDSVYNKWLPRWLSGIELPANEGDEISISGSERSPGEVNDKPTLVFLPRKIAWTEEPGGLPSIGTQLKWLSTSSSKIPREFLQAESWAQYKDPWDWLNSSLALLLELWSGQALGSELSSFSPGFTSYQPHNTIKLSDPQSPYLGKRGNNDSVCSW